MDVAIIGAGASGLIFGDIMSKAGYSVTIFEHKEQLGGVWNMTTDKPPPPFGETNTQDNVERLARKVSPMYESLCTNLPGAVMQIPGVSMDSPGSHTTRYFTRMEVDAYLTAYGQRVKSLIRFGRKVVRLSPSTDETTSAPKWQLTFQDGSVHAASRVVVANGHYAVPQCPEILQGSPICHHSIFYNDPCWYDGKRVLVVGGGPSGRDLVAELAKRRSDDDVVHWVCEEELHLLENVRCYPRIVAAHGNSVTFTDETVLEVDVILCATGYRYEFPFLEGVLPNLLCCDGRVVMRLYRHLIHLDHPSLAFAVIPFKIAPFPVAYAQAHFLTHSWKLSLTPQLVDRWRDEYDVEQSAMNVEGIALKYRHRLGNRQWDYMNRLLHDSQQPLLPPVVRRLYDLGAGLQKEWPLGEYKHAVFEIDGEDIKIRRNQS